MKFKLLFFVCAVLFLPLSVAAQTGSVFKINNALSEAKLAATSLADSEDQDDRFLFELNEEIFEGGYLKVGSTIAVETAPGKEWLLDISRVSNYMPGTTSYIARDVNDESRVFTFTYSESGLQGIFHESYDVAHRFTKDIKRALNFVEPNSTNDVLACHTDKEHNELANSLLSSENIRRKQGNVAQNMSTSLEDSVVIDLLLQVTTNAVTWALGSNAFADINEVLAQALNLSQSVLDNSGTAIELRLVLMDVIELTSTEQALPTVEKRNRLQAGSGSFLETRMLRDENGADLVALVDEIFDTGGIAFVPTNPLTTASLGFSVNRVQQIGNGFTLIHEIGHDMGNFHARTQNRGPGPSRGAAFHFSVGIQDLENGFNTIMGDRVAGLGEAPVFASPDVLHRQLPTGIDRPIEPINSALTLKLLKGTVASYRPTIVEPPVPGVSIPNIDISLGTGEQMSVPLKITNTGESRLTWNLDFVSDDNLIETTTNENDAQILYTTSFEADQGFAQIGSFPGISNWRTFATNDQVEVSNLRAREGSQHLQISFSGSGNSRVAVSPFLGSMPLARYEVDFDVQIGSVQPGDTETRSHAIFVRDTRSQKIAAGLRITNGEVQTWGAFPGFPAIGEYFDTGVITGFQAYRNIRFVMNPETQKIEYYLDDVLIAENDYLSDANSPDQVFFEFGNEFSTSFMSVDNVEIRSFKGPYNWLEPEMQSGSVAEGEDADIMLNFSGVGIEPGTYETMMTVLTNSAETPTIEVPVSLTVNLSVSNEEGTGIPTEVALDQNFPNPFNPTTNITFRLNRASNVSLTVYNMLGQQVASVAQGRFVAGSHTVPFNAAALSSGVYVYQLQAGGVLLNRKLTLIK